MMYRTLPFSSQVISDQTDREKKTLYNFVEQTISRQKNLKQLFK